MASESARARNSLLKLAIPIVASNASLALMQVTDGAIVGRLGVQELAALTPAAMLIFLLASFGYAMFSIITTFAAQAVGKGEQAESARYTWQAIYLSLGFGALFIGLFHPLADGIFRLFSADPELRALEVSYFQIGLFSIVPEFVATALCCYFVGVHRPWIVAFITIGGVLSNVVFSIGLVFGRWGLPELGFEGAAIGTLCATVLTAALLIGVFLSSRERRERKSHDFRFSRGRTLRLLKTGLPAGGQGALDTFSWGVILTWLVSQLPDSELAASSVIIRCLQISFLPAEGVGSALITKVGDAIGAGDPPGAKRFADVGFRIIASYMCAVGLLFFVFRIPLMSLFSNSPEVIAAGASAMIFVSAFQFFDAMNINYLHALHGAGDTLWSCVVNGILSIVVLLTGGMFVVRSFPEWGASGIWAVAALYVILQGICFRSRWKSDRWTNIAQLIEKG